jgi:distribution and morphology protein 31
VADLKFPRDHSNDVDINAILSEIVENLTHAVSGEAWERQVGAVDADDQPIPGQHALSGPAIEAPVTALGPAAESAWRQQLAEREAQREKEEAERLERRRRRFRRRRINREMLSQDAAEAEAAQNVARRMETEHAEENGEPAHEQEQEEGQRAVPPPAVVIDLDVRFRDIKAAVPLFHSELGYRTQTFVRPIVAFMNANKVSPAGLYHCFDVAHTFRIDSDPSALPSRHGSRESDRAPAACAG